MRIFASGRKTSTFPKYTYGNSSGIIRASSYGNLNTDDKVMKKMIKYWAILAIYL